MMKANRQIIIKKQYGQTVIAFGSNGLPLEKRPDSDIIELGIIARQSGDKSILKLFDELPSLAELKAMKMEKVEQKLIQSGIEKINHK